MFTEGIVVFSKSGRDKARPFIVVSVEKTENCEYLYLVDGSLRKLEKPKKKKSKHVQVTGFLASDIQRKLRNNEKILDAEIRKFLLPYANAGDVLKSSEEVRELVER